MTRGTCDYVLEGPLWASVRAFLVPDDVLCMRTTAEKWNAAGLYGPFAELCFVLLKKDVKNGQLPNSKRPEHEIPLQTTVRIQPGLSLS